MASHSAARRNACAKTGLPPPSSSNTTVPPSHAQSVAATGDPTSPQRILGGPTAPPDLHRGIGPAAHSMESGSVGSSPPGRPVHRMSISAILSGGPTTQLTSAAGEDGISLAPVRPQSLPPTTQGGSVDPSITAPSQAATLNSYNSIFPPPA